MKSTEILLSIKLQQQLFIDPKRIRLLKQIERCGSINQAAKNANVSYKSAWDHLEAMDKISPKPLLERNTGGKNGGGTQLTTYAKRILQLYDLLEKTQQQAFHILQDENIPLDSLLSATARFAVQTSARNQFFGKVAQQRLISSRCMVAVHIEDFPTPLQVAITSKSSVRLKLITGKEVMTIFKVGAVKIMHQMEQNDLNQYAAIVQSINSEEVILKLTHSPIEFCASPPADLTLQLNQEVYLKVDPEQIILAAMS